LSDDFNDNSRDPKWTLGSLNEGPAANDPLVQALEQNQRLQITTRAGQTGNHFNGYVSTGTWNFTGALSSVEVVKVARPSEYADTAFAVGVDSNNWFRFVHEHGQLYFQRKVGGAKTSTNVTYNPVAHRFWRLRHNTGTDQVVFETSPDGLAWVVRRTVARTISISAARFELCAGTFNWNDVADTAIFDNFVLETPGVTALAQPFFQFWTDPTATAESREEAEPLTGLSHTRQLSWWIGGFSKSG
jgi:hypothetical protein